ncbi:MAG: tetratricopeptide repeat protein [Burkholderiales bacterium]
MSTSHEGLQPLLAKASAKLQGGQLQEAETLYRQVLERDPGHADATHFLGICLVQSGRKDEGLPLLSLSLRLAPERVMYRHNYGLMLAAAGELVAAEKTLAEAIALEPGNATSHGYLGMVRQQLGRLDDALAAYRAGIERRPDDPIIAGNLGYCLLEKGEIESALVWIRRSLAREPRNPVVVNNLGSALRAAGDVRAAIESYRKAVELDPRYATAWHNLGTALREVSDRRGSFDALHNAVHAGPDFAPAWQEFAEEFSQARFHDWDPLAAQELTRVLLHPTVDAGPLAEAASSLLALDPDFAPVIRALRTDEESAAGCLQGKRLEALAHPLLLALIENALVPDPEFELFLRALRAHAIAAWRKRALADSPRLLELLCALAQQCFLNEYLWPESAGESAGAEQLAALAQAQASPAELALLAAYRPLAGIPGLARPASGSQAFDRMWRRQVEEPAEEARLRGEIPALTPIADDVSRAVREQYEQNPYPRWHRVPASLTTAYPLRRRLRTLFPHLEPSRITAPESPDILIAGGGTGYQAAITALLNPTGRVLAVDLSRASLAYAMRRCSELGVSNVRFAQGDILRLGSLPERFDLVECTGVLHHLRDPLAGWRTLVSLLNPGGVMRIALYSELGRRGVVAARELAARLGLGGDMESIRAARKLVFEQPGESPARSLTLSRDFYSASGARDLMLHVQEHRFTTARLRQAIEALGLEFLGFEFTDLAVLRDYQQRHPEDPAAVSLEKWGQYEASNPHIFAGMYQFWVIKPD